MRAAAGGLPARAPGAAGPGGGGTFSAAQFNALRGGEPTFEDVAAALAAADVGGVLDGAAVQGALETIERTRTASHALLARAGEAPLPAQSTEGDRRAPRRPSKRLRGMRGPVEIFLAQQAKDQSRRGSAMSTASSSGRSQVSSDVQQLITPGLPGLPPTTTAGAAATASRGGESPTSLASPKASLLTAGCAAGPPGG